MIALDRAGLTPPADWAATVAAAFADHAAFVAAAEAFERLPLNSRRRRAGFKVFASQTLAGPGGRADWAPRWKAVKPLFEAWGNGLCAYCMGAVSANQFGDVEHVAPKSLFPSRAYDCGNYLLSCRLCNHGKADRWPRSGGYARPDRAGAAGRFVYTDRGAIRAADGQDRDARFTVRDCRLRRRGLTRERRVAIRDALRAMGEMMALAVPEASKRRLVRTLLLGADRPYATAVNQAVRRAWGRAGMTSPL